jgi:hypothetical protein
MYSREDFEICGWGVYYYVILKGKNSYYLWKDGTLNKGSTGYKGGSYEIALGYWSTRSEAEQFLANYLKEQRMGNLDQVRKDIELLKKEEARLLEEQKKNKQTFKHGQWFKDSDNHLMMLSQVGCKKYALVDKGGNRRMDPITPETHDITWDELAKMYPSVRNLTPIKVCINEVL